MDIRKNFFMETVVKHWHRLPWAVEESQPWRDVNAVWLWHLGTQVSGELGSAAFVVRLDDLTGLFQP